MTAPLTQSLTDNPRLDRWVGFEGDRTVRIATGKVELGQGVLTALVQIAAEELDVPPARIRLVSGVTAQSPNEGYTAGSRSIEESGGSIRLVCAEVRGLFLDHIAGVLDCPRAELAIEDGAVLRNGAATGFDYWSLNEKIDLARPATGAAPVKRPAEFRLIGRNLARLDLPAKVAGAAFVHDLAPAGVKHARVVRQPRRGAALKSIDEAAIRRATRDRVELVRDGDFLAIVADDETVAMQAVDIVRRHSVWEGGVAVPADAGEPAFMMAQPSKDRVIESGAEAAGKAVRTLEATYARPFIAHASLAPSCALAHFADGRLTVWSHAQGVYQLRNAIARALGLAPDNVTVLHRQGAGCYGHNGADDAGLDAALVARALPGRTVRVQWSREDELSAAPFGSAMTVRMHASLDARGRPLEWTHEVWSAVHGQRPGMAGNINLLAATALPNAPPPPEPVDVPDAGGGGGTRNSATLYDFPRQRVVHHLVTHMPVRTSSLRTLGGFANVFAAESFMDELADAAGEDPVSYRLSLLSEPRARRVIEAAARMCGWSGRGERGSGTARGLGFARYKNKAGYAAVIAEVKVDEAVRVKQIWCAVDGGLIISPDGARNQIEGGAIQATSWTLKEAVRFDDGRVASITWDDYPILRFSEVPAVEIELIDAPHEPPLGLGEVVHGPTAAAIGNAVAHALGARVRNLPLTRERIMAAVL
ncbi:MAG TPA: molybdopterin cofactor-binding domain-containing protein [Xanthobacteraceae bacterium]|nr:molybdopterin cofactor-binding domain-containing protein [Xanthobacteraceae bacterium]